MDITEASKTTKAMEHGEKHYGPDGNNSSESVDCDYSIYKATESSYDGDSTVGSASDDCQGTVALGSVDKSVHKDDDKDTSSERATDDGPGVMAQQSSDGGNFIQGRTSDTGQESMPKRSLNKYFEVEDEDLSTERASDNSHQSMAKDSSDRCVDENDDFSRDEASSSAHELMAQSHSDEFENKNPPTVGSSNYANEPIPKGILDKSLHEDVSSIASDKGHESEARVGLDDSEIHCERYLPDEGCHPKIGKESFAGLKKVFQTTSAEDSLKTESSSDLPSCFTNLPAVNDKPPAAFSSTSESETNSIYVPNAIQTFHSTRDTDNEGSRMIQTPVMSKKSRSRRKSCNVRKVCNTQHIVSAEDDTEVTFFQSPDFSVKDSFPLEGRSGNSIDGLSGCQEHTKEDPIKEEKQDEDMYLDNCVVSFGKDQDMPSRHRRSVPSSKPKDAQGKSRKAKMDPRLLSYLQLNAKNDTKKIEKRSEKKNVEKIKKIENKTAKKINKKILEKIEKKNAKKEEKKYGKKEYKKKEKQIASHAETKDNNNAVLFSFTPQELFELVIEEKSDTEFKCRNCKQVFVKKDEAFTHMDDHHPFKCNLCSLKFITLNLLESHSSAEHNEIFRCPYCTKVSTSSGGLHRHILVNHKGNQATSLSLAMCHICGKVFNENVGFKSHMEQVHQEAAPLKVDQFHCPVCSKVFRSNNGLRRHMDFHADRVQSCPFPSCSFKAQYKAHMEIHCNQIHLGINLLPCPFEGCPKKARRKVELEDHLNMVHYKIKNFECESCGRKFTSKKYLTVHELIHTDSKPLACNFCDYRCRQRSALSWHMKKKHSDETDDKREPPHKLFGSRFRPALKPGRKPKTEEEEPKQKRAKLDTGYENTEERLVDEFIKNVIQTKQFANSMGSEQIAFPNQMTSEHSANSNRMTFEHFADTNHKGSEHITYANSMGSEQIAKKSLEESEPVANPVEEK